MPSLDGSSLAEPGSLGSVAAAGAQTLGFPLCVAALSQKGTDMAKQRSSFAKLQRDRAKAAKRAAKVANKTGSGTPQPVAVYDGAPPPEVEEPSPTSASKLFEGKGQLTAPELLQMIEDVHKMREKGSITEEEFEEAKVEIFARLPMD